MKKTGFLSRRVRRNIGRGIIVASALFWFWKRNDSFDSELSLAGFIIGLGMMDIRRPLSPGSSSMQAADGGKQPAPDRIRPRVWVLAIASPVVAAASYAFMYVDQYVYGGRWLWPLYLFAASFMTSVAVWIYILLKKAGMFH